MTPLSPTAQTSVGLVPQASLIELDVGSWSVKTVVPSNRLENEFPKIHRSVDEKPMMLQT